MDRPPKSGSDGLRPLPKPIMLDLPKERPKPQRRLHEHNDNPMPDYDYTQTQEDEAPRKKRKEPEPKRPTGGYFKSAQKAYGQKRRKPKPEPKPKKRPTKTHDPSRPRLGQGDRLYNPYTPKEPLIPKTVRRAFRFWALGLIAIAFIVLVLMSMLRNNAWAVYLDERFVGYMPINREIEMSTVHDDAVRHLASSLGATVIVREQTIVREARARNSDVIPAQAMTAEISQRFTFQIEAAAIYIDGEHIANLRNQTEAQHVESELQRPFLPEGDLVSISFEEDWQIRTATVDSIDDLDTTADVINMLERDVSNIHLHTIRTGDTQGALALQFETTIERIGELNNITPETILRVGETLYIEQPGRRLTVRTVEEVIITEDVPMEEIEVPNDDMHVSETTVLVEGSYGERAVTQHITRVNRIIVGAPEVISIRILREPVTREIEVGTSTAMTVR